MARKASYKSRLGVLGGFGILIMGIAAAFATGNLYLRMILLMFTVAWSFFVAMGVYNVFISHKKP